MFKDVSIGFGLRLENLRGHVYDGASDMSGAYNGAQAILLKVQPLAHYPISCHSVPTLLLRSSAICLVCEVFYHI